VGPPSSQRHLRGVRACVREVRYSGVSLTLSPRTGAVRLSFGSLCQARCSAACEAHVWLGLLSHIEFSTIPLLDSVLKSLVNQCSLLPVLAALFLIAAASAFLQGMPLSELSDTQAVGTTLANGFSTRYAYSASFWLFWDSLTLSLVPIAERRAPSEGVS